MTDAESGGGRGGDGDDAPSERALRWAELAATLVLSNEALPGPASVPSLESVRARYLRRRLMWRFGVGVFSVATSAALATVLVLALSGRYEPRLSYVVDGASVVQSNSIEAPPASVSTAAGAAADSAALSANGTRVRFSEGTEIMLAPGARLGILARSPVGADLALDRGRARFAVVHRPSAKWRVSAGPFVVDVTGTRFSLEWASDLRQLTLDLESGGVVVHGNAAGQGVAVGPGERLVASSVDGRVTVRPTPTNSAVSRGRGRSTPGSIGGNCAPTPALADLALPDMDLGPSPDGRVETAAARDREEDGSPPITNRRGGGTTRAGASPFGRLRALPLDLALASPSRRATDRFSELQPPPVLAPSAPSLVMGGGGLFCTKEGAALGFENMEGGVSVPPYYHTAFSAPRADGSHSWCGLHSQRLDVKFTEQGRPNFMGRLPNQSGQVVIRLPRQMDFTDKTVSLHMFIDGPPDARVAAQLFVIHHGKWVNGPLVDHLVPRRWWTISHTYRAENPLTVGPPYPPAGTSLVTDCDRVALLVYSTGGPRTWSGALYIDEVGWK